MDAIDIEAVLDEFSSDCFDNLDDSDIDPHYVHRDAEQSSSSEEEPTDEQSKRSVSGQETFREVVSLQKTRRKGTVKERDTKKLKRNTGQEYVTEKGKTVRARCLKPLENCRMKCNEKLTAETRKIVFEEYWAIGNYNGRVTYISSLIEVKEKSSTRPRQEDPAMRKNRQQTLNYCFNVNGMKIKCCQKCFLRTFDETDNFIKSVTAKKLQTVGGTETYDRRGMTSPSFKWPVEKLEEVKHHILSFPSYESHYTRRQNDSRYLQPHLTLKKMYDLYKECSENPVSYPYYSKEFHALKLKFKKPKQDTCHRCDVYEMKIKTTLDIIEKERLSHEKDEHLTKAEQAYDSKKVDKEKALNTDTLKSYTFDLQQCLATPNLATSVSFYKRQLWTFNLTIRDGAAKTSTHFMWYETIAKRGGNEIASCLYKMLESVPSTVKHICLYSDTCGGQNKNSYVAAMFSVAVQLLPIDYIDHKFMVPGHSHMEVDADHSLIEKKKKKTDIQIYHPHDWFQLVRSTSTKFSVIEMKQVDFLEFSSLYKNLLMKGKKNDAGDPFKWHDVQWLQYRKTDPGKFFFKHSLSTEETFQSISFLRRGKKKEDFAVPFQISSNALPISDEKKKDLMDLLPTIPEVFHDFYMKLPSVSNQQQQKSSYEDPDLVDLESDCE